MTHGNRPPPIAREIFQGINVSALLIALQCKEGGLMADYISNQNTPVTIT